MKKKYETVTRVALLAAAVLLLIHGQEMAGWICLLCALFY